MTTITNRVQESLQSSSGLLDALDLAAGMRANKSSDCLSYLDLAKPVNRMANPGPLMQAFETEIVNQNESAAESRRAIRCKMIQAVALAALLIIGVVGAFVLTSLYAANYAPVVLFVGTYFLIGHMGQFLNKNFRDVWKNIERTAKKVELIAKKHYAITQNDAYKQNLLRTYTPNDKTHLTKYIYLAAHRHYWLEESNAKIKEHIDALKAKQSLTESINTVGLNDEKKRSIYRQAVMHSVQAQQSREDGLESRVEALFIEALMHRPDYKGKKEDLYTTYSSRLPITILKKKSEDNSTSEFEADLRLDVSLFESQEALKWTMHFLTRDLPPYQDTFLNINENQIFLRSQIVNDSTKIIQAFIQAMDEQMNSMRQALNQSGSSNRA
jgi:hypothetical protein